MKERIKVNGVDIDLAVGNSLNIVIKSNIMKKSDELSASYSYTYNAPITNKNLAVFGQVMILGTKPKVRQYLDAEYYRDEYLIFRGKVYVSECNRDSISLRFIFGVNDAIFKIKEDKKNLCDLWNNIDDNTYLKYYLEDDLLNYKVTSPCPATDCAPYPFTYRKATEFFMGTINVGGGSYNDQAITPAINVGALLDRIESVYGLKLDDSLTKDKLWLICNKKKRYDMFSVAMTETNQQFGQLYVEWRDYIESYVDGVNGDDIGNRIYFDYYYDDTKRIYNWVDIKHPYKIRKIHLSATGFNYSSGICYYVPEYTNEEKGYVAKELFRWSSPSDVIDADFFPEETNMKFQFDAGTGPTIEFKSNEGRQISISNLKLTFYCQFDDSETNKGYLNIFDCLPDISISNFISQYLFGVDGKFPINSLKKTDSVKCVNLYDISTNTPYDWSKKLMLEDIKVINSIDGYCKKNYVKVAKMGDVRQMIVNLKTEDETLDKEEDFFVSEFGQYFPPNYVLTKNFTSKQENVPVIVRIQIGKSQEYDGNLYALPDNANLDWMNDANQSFKIMKDIFLHPLRLECNIKLSSNDLANIDLCRPVYFSQFGQYFFIDELSVGEDSTKAKLTRITF